LLTPVVLSECAHVLHSYWPIVNLINFMYVPATRRVLAVNVGAMAWNSYLR